MQNTLLVAMKEKRITQKDIAGLLGIHYNTVSLKIRGRENRVFTLDEAAQIHHQWFAGYDFAELFSVEKKENSQ